MHRNTLILCLLLTIIAACTPVSKPVQITATPDLPTLTIYEVEIAPTSLQITATPPVFPTRIPENPPTTAPPIPPPPQEVAEIPIPQGDAQVAQDSGDLRLRSEPRRADNIITLLDEFTPLDIIGRTDDNFWLEVIIPDGRRGWVMAQFVDVHVDLNSITSVVEPQPDVQPVDVAGVVSNITGKSNEIFANGQARGNRANVFSKVGDSLTVATYTLYPVGWGQYNLRGYGNLQSVVNYFSSATARDSNSYANTSLAADNGWTSADILDPGRANPGVCQPGESPLVCEYRVVKPSVALILLGTNDVSALSADAYRANMTRIVEISIEMGVIPVLSTVPPRVSFDGQVDQFNGIVRQIASAYSIPLWDYGNLMQGLPNRGLLDDGVHPSFPPGEYTAAADFTPENLQYGYTLRNLTALQVLDVIWRNVLQ